LQPTFILVESEIRAGHFTRAVSLLNESNNTLRLSDPWRFDALRTEVLYQTGQHAIAARLTKQLSHESLPQSLQARVAYVAAMVDFESGRFGTSLERITQAVALAEKSGDANVRATTQLGLLRLVSDSEGASAPLLRDVRRAIASTGDPHLMVALRLHFARVEASRYSPNESERHLNAANALLNEFPNVWLQGRVHLGLSIVSTLIGDLERAIEEAQSAIQCASSSGHRRTEWAGHINLSHALQAQGALDAAKQSIDRVLADCSQDVEIVIAALDSQANLLIRQQRFNDARDCIDQIDRRLESVPLDLHTRWASFMLSETRIRLQQAEERWVAAESEAISAMNRATARRNSYWYERFALLRWRALVGLGRFSELSDSLMRFDAPWTLEALAEKSRVLGHAALATSRTEHAQEFFRRASRIGIIGNHNLEGLTVLSQSGTGDEQAPGASDVPGPPDLDSAVALIELGAHTHILAREALAVIDAARCARGAAIVATGAEGPRVIDRRGWDEAAAAAAARKSGACEVIPLGDHRDEPWQLVVDPQPELDHRCSLIAIRKLIGMALTLERYRRDEQQRAALWPAESLDSDPESIWASEQMSEVLGVARRVAPTPLSLLLTGETGTGKEMLARAIHRASDRADRPMIPFNCTAVPRDMIESQLFGYRRGSFTGADASFAGVIRSAAGGTLFLDEIADVPVDVQPKLLRFLETHEIHPLGETQPVKVDVRVIAATNARLEELVAEGRFREDLFYRLNVVRLKLPPLRERREEIPPLVDHYLRKYGDEQKKGRLTLADETLEYLLLYSWPGNVRQLANEVRRMVAMAEADSALTPVLLSPEIQASRRTIPAGQGVEPEVRVRIDQPLPAAVELLEQTMVKSALDKTHGRVEEAARILGISRKGLFLKRRRWGLSLQHH